MDHIKSSQDGFSAVEALIILVVICLITSIGYYIYKSKSSNRIIVGNTVKTIQTDAEQNKLDKIKYKIGQLDHRTDIAVSTYTIDDIKMTDPTSMVTLPPYFTFIFNGSSYANDKNIAPVGTAGPNGSGGNQALQRDKIDTILKYEGLTQSAKNGTEPGITITYESKLVLCTEGDSIGVATVSCIGKKEFNQDIADIKTAFQALKNKFSNVDTTQYSIINYTEGTTDEVKGIYISNLTGSSMKQADYGAYLVKLSGSWRYIASNTAGRQGQLSPSCDVINKPEYHNVFKSYYPAPCGI